MASRLMLAGPARKRHPAFGQAEEGLGGTQRAGHVLLDQDGTHARHR